jgi:hypothetical protein
VAEHNVEDASLAIIYGKYQRLLDPDLDIVAPFEKFVGLLLQP